MVSSLTWPASHQSLWWLSAPIALSGFTFQPLGYGSKWRARKKKWLLWPQWNPTFEPHLILGLVENRILRNPRVCHRIPHSFSCLRALGDFPVWDKPICGLRGTNMWMAASATLPSMVAVGMTARSDAPGVVWRLGPPWNPWFFHPILSPVKWLICWATFWDKFIVIYPHEVYNSPIFDPLSLGCKECRWLETECKKLCFDRPDFWKLDAGNIYRGPPESWWEKTMASSDCRNMKRHQKVYWLKAIHGVCGFHRPVSCNRPWLAPAIDRQRKTDMVNIPQPCYPPVIKLKHALLENPRYGWFSCEDPPKVFSNLKPMKSPFFMGKSGKSSMNGS